MIRRTQEALSNEEDPNMDEMQKELAFYKSQTKVLREKNRDLRNALLHAEAQQGTEEPPQETAQESLSDIRKIIADSKKTISEKLSQFKETIEDSSSELSATDTKPSTEVSASNSSNGAPAPPKYSAVMDTSETKEPSQEVSSAPISAEAEILQNQVIYLKKEIDRLETFLEQSEMVNDRLRMLLTEHSIDVSEISKAINEASKTAISSTAVKTEELVKDEPKIAEKPKEVSISKEQPKVEPKPKPEKKDLDPAVLKLFNDFKAKLDKGMNDDDIKMEILEFRETLMDYIPHSRVFYEMQVEYRKWKRDSSSVEELRKAMETWKETIASTM